MTPALDEKPTGRTISAPVEMVLSPLTLLRWMAILDMAIAAESDAGRPAMAKELRNLRCAMGDLFPPEMRLNEEPEK